jgi:hypothetical protein
MAVPAVVGVEPEEGLPPLRVYRAAVPHGGRHLVVTLAEDVRAHEDALADNGLGRVPPAVDGRRDALNLDA